MTPDEFREIALGFPGTEERSHMDHPDFRVDGKIFATLGPDLTWGMAKLTPEQQQVYLRTESATFKPASGAGDSGVRRSSRLRTPTRPRCAQPFVQHGETLPRRLLLAKTIVDVGFSSRRRGRILGQPFWTELALVSIK